jgi:photosystem II stability/assembly factor-like uncharacterized protein
MLGVCLAGKRLVAVGERGRILLSDNDGVTWRQASSPVSVTLTAVAFPTPQQGWVVGHFGVVLHSKDGGETWTKQLDGTQAAEQIKQVAEARLKNARAETPALKQELATAEQFVQDGPDKPFLALYFRNDQSGFVIGAYNLIFRTDDGGKTWQPWCDRVENPEGLHLYAMHRSGKNLYIAGERGLVLRSSDGGETFKKVTTPYVGSYFGLVAAQTGDLVLFGLRGNVYWSGSDGRSWKKIEIGLQKTFATGIELSDGIFLLTTQDGEAFASQDHGRSFQQIPFQPSAFTDVTQTPDGTVVFASLRGMIRYPRSELMTTNRGVAK